MDRHSSLQSGVTELSLGGEMGKDQGLDAEQSHGCEDVRINLCDVVGKLG